MKKAANNSGRSEAATAKLNAKVVLLESWVAFGVAEGVVPPKSMAQLRDWSDESRSIERIGSPSTTDPNRAPHNAKLIKRAYEAMASMKRPASRKRVPKKPLEEQLRLEQEKNEKLEGEKSQLTGQIARLLHELREERGSHAKAQRDIERLSETVRDMRRKQAQSGARGPRPIT